jgi:hypothetical protein
LKFVNKLFDYYSSNSTDDEKLIVTQAFIREYANGKSFPVEYNSDNEITSMFPNIDDIREQIVVPSVGTNPSYISNNKLLRAVELTG